MESTEHKIVSFKTYLLILLALIVLTIVSVLVTKLDFGIPGIAVALSMAGIKSILVFSYFMHLLYDKRMYAFMVVGVLIVMTAVLIITFLDYSF